MDKVYTIFLVLYFILSFLSLFETEIVLINSLIVFISSFFLAFNLNYIRKNHFRLLFVFFLFSFYSVACLYLFQGKVTFTPIRVFVHFSLFIVVVRYNISPRVIKWLLFSYIGYILFLLFIKGVYINAIFPGTSKNIIGWFAIGISVFYYILEYERKTLANNRFDLFPAVITCFICLVSLSRSNIICSILLLIGVLWFNYRVFTLIKKALFLIFLIIALGFLYYYFWNLLELGLQRFEERGLESSERSLFLESYISKIDVYTFFLGVDSNQYPFTLINGNFHNSFLLGHSNFGVLFLLLLIFILCLLIKKIFSSTVLVILTLSLLIRSYTDTIMFIGDFDFIIFFVLYKLKKD